MYSFQFFQSMPAYTQTYTYMGNPISSRPTFCSHKNGLAFDSLVDRSPYEKLESK